MFYTQRTNRLNQHIDTYHPEDTLKDAVAHALAESQHSDEADPPIVVMGEDYAVIGFAQCGEIYFSPYSTIGREYLSALAGHEPPTDSQLARQTKSLAGEFGCRVMELATYHDGFSFMVDTEFDAYRIAHKYQHCRETRVNHAPNVGGWLVQVFNEPMSSPARHTAPLYVVINATQENRTCHGHYYPAMGEDGNCYTSKLDAAHAHLDMVDEFGGSMATHPICKVVQVDPAEFEQFLRQAREERAAE